MKRDKYTKMQAGNDRRISGYPVCKPLILFPVIRRSAFQIDRRRDLVNDCVPFLEPDFWVLSGLSSF